MRTGTSRVRLVAFLALALACDGEGGGPAGPGPEIFHPTDDVVLEGRHAFDAMTIPVGVTVTASGDLALEVAGEVRVLGALVGDCVGIEIAGGSTVRVEGVVSNGCEGEPPRAGPALSIVGDGDVVLRGATIESGGPATISNDPALGADAFPGAPRREGRTLRLETSLLRSVPGRAPSGADGGAGGPGTDGVGWTILSSDALVIAGPTTIAAQDGGHGGAGLGSGSAARIAVQGGDGGAPGVLTLAAAGELRLEPPTAPAGLAPARAVPILDLARAGDGGRAEVVAADRDGAERGVYEARGGDAGRGALSFRLAAAGFAIPVPEDVSPVRLRIPPPGRGGSARVVAPGGADATADAPARPGPVVVAEVGAPGSLPDLCPTPGEGPCRPAAHDVFRVWLNHDGIEPGPAIDVDVGGGGDGSPERPDGAAGADLTVGGPPWLGWNGSHDSTVREVDDAVDAADPDVVASAIATVRISGTAGGGDGADRCGAPGGAGGPGGRLRLSVPLAALAEALGAAGLEPVLGALAPAGRPGPTLAAGLLDGGAGGDGAPAGAPGAAGTVESGTDVDDPLADAALARIGADAREAAAPAPGPPGAVCR